MQSVRRFLTSMKNLKLRFGIINDELKLFELYLLQLSNLSHYKKQEEKFLITIVEYKENHQVQKINSHV